MRLSREKFREKIEDPWTAAFKPPYEARAERRDYGNQVGLAVYKDGEKLFDAPDLPSEHVLGPGMLRSITRDVKRRLGITNTE